MLLTLDSVTESAFGGSATRLTVAPKWNSPDRGVKKVINRGVCHHNNTFFTLFNLQAQKVRL